MVLVARSADRLSELADVIRSATGVQAEVLPADLSDASDRGAVVARILDAERPISMVVNNAGFSLGTTILDTTWEAERAALDVMVTATMQLSHAAAQAMTARGHGAIVNISSIAAYLANGNYAAHKRWVLDFTEALAGQLAGTGVSASVVVPGLVRTEFHDSASLAHMKDQYPSLAWLTPDVVVTAALAGVRRKQVVVTPSVRYLAAAGLLRLVPKALTRSRTGRL